MASKAVKRKRERSPKSKRMRICYVNPTRLLKRPLVEIATHMSKRAAVSILYPRKLFSKPDNSMHYSKLPSNIEPVTYGSWQPPIQSEQPVPGILFFWKMHRVLKKNDIIHAWVPSYFSNLFLMAWRKMFFPQTTLILTMDTVPAYSFSLGPYWDFLQRLFSRVFQSTLYKSPTLVTLYGEQLTSHARQVGVPPKRIRILGTGIHPHPSTTDKKRDQKRAKNGKDGKAKRKQIRKKLGVAHGELLVLFIGIMNDRKGASTLINVADRLKQRERKNRGDIKVRFICAGDGPALERYKRSSQERDLKGMISFLGFRKDVHSLYQAADLLLLPSHGEGLPGVIMEGMAAGLPIVASRIPCIPDLVEEGVEGFMHFPLDEIGFTRSILRLCKDRDLRKRMGRAAKKKAHSFLWARILPQYERLYQEALHLSKDRVDLHVRNVQKRQRGKNHG